MTLAMQPLNPSFGLQTCQHRGGVLNSGNDLFSLCLQGIARARKSSNFLWVEAAVAGIIPRGIKYRQVHCFAAKPPLDEWPMEKAAALSQIGACAQVINC